MTDLRRHDHRIILHFVCYKSFSAIGIGAACAETGTGLRLFLRRGL